MEIHHNYRSRPWGYRWGWLLWMDIYDQFRKKVSAKPAFFSHQVKANAMLLILHIRRWNMCEGAGHVQTFNFKALYTSTRLTYSIILSPHQAIKPHWKTSSLWSMVAIWKDNLGPPGYSLILVLYNNLRQRLCSRFNSSNLSKKSVIW